MILTEATRLLSKDGMSGFTINEVAAAAGVGKTTIYRRWPTREALVIAAIKQIADRYTVPNLGSVREDLIAYLGTAAAQMTKPRNRRLHADLLQAAANSSSFAASYRTMISSRREMIKAVLDRGVERGELRPDFDRDVVPDLLVGPLTQRQLVTGDKLTDSFVETLVDAVLCGLQPR